MITTKSTTCENADDAGLQEVARDLQNDARTCKPADTPLTQPRSPSVRAETGPARYEVVDRPAECAENGRCLDLPNRGGPAENQPGRSCCKQDESCCDFCCGN